MRKSTAKDPLMVLPTSKIEFKPSELDKALRDILDLFERCLTPFYLTHQTALDIKNNMLLGGDRVTVAVKESQITPEIRSTLDTEIIMLHRDIKWSVDGFRYLVDNVPVEVKIIKGDYQFFNNPDSRFHNADEYLIPNPFDEYWKVKDEII